MAQKTGIINRSGISKSALNMTGVTDTRKRLTIAAGGMSTPGVNTKNNMIVIRRPTEPKYTLFSTAKNITDRFRTTIVTALK
jgi:hypothetical protein